MVAPSEKVVSNLEPNRIYLNPDSPEATIRQLDLYYELEPEVLDILSRILTLYRRPAWLYVIEAFPGFDDQALLLDRFTFDVEIDALILFANDPHTFIDGMIEMAMYLVGFSTMIGVEDEWMIEFAIGAWKPIKNRVKERLGIPVPRHPQWIIEIPGGDEDSHPAQQAFLDLLAELNTISFTQMVRLAARNDVEIQFPPNTDPSVIEVYVRMKVAIEQVADGLGLDDWRKFNRRLLEMVLQLKADYLPQELPQPDSAWPLLFEDEFDEEDAIDEFLPEDMVISDDGWNPFEAYVEQLFSQTNPHEDEQHDEKRPDNEDWV